MTEEERRYMALKLAVELRKGNPVHHHSQSTVETAKMFEAYLRGEGR